MKTMKLYLYSSALRARFGAKSIEDPVDVPEEEALAALAAGAARAVRGVVVETATVEPKEKATETGGDEGAADAGEKDAGGADEGKGEGEELPEWTPKTPPEEYLVKYPDGKFAELAARYVAAVKK